jgi:hypothetical protein
MPRSWVKNGPSYMPEYHADQNAKDRCTNPKSQRWYTHGGRGIKFLFNSFNEFYAEVGARPTSQHSLERPNNDGNYEKGNVVWATRSEQQKNKRPFTHLIRHGKGCYFHKLSGKWMARIKYKGVTHYLGLFLTEDDARQAYTVAKQNLGVS